MRLKTYFATSVEAAIARARAELGSDAMLVHSRRFKQDSTGGEQPVSGGSPNDPRTDHELPQNANYEVVFAVEASPVADETLPDLLAAHEPAGKAGNNRNANESSGSPALSVPGFESMERLERSIQEIQASLFQVAESIHFSSLQDRKRKIAGRYAATAFADLRHCGFSDNFALTLLTQLDDTGKEPNRAGLREELARRINCKPGLGNANANRTVTALLGPAGSGKTALCAKLAAQMGIARRRSTHLISIDSGRVGSSNLLCSLAELLGVGVTVLESATALPERLDRIRHADLILIDTPGFSPHPTLASLADGSSVDEDFIHLQLALKSRPEIETQLVLPATFESGALRRHLSHFLSAGPSRLIFSHFDAAGLIGDKLEFAIESGLPLSFVSTGQNIPEDLHDANARELCVEALDHLRQVRPSFVRHKLAVAASEAGQIPIESATEPPRRAAA